MSEKRVVWVTKYALTDGIRLVEVVHFGDSDRYAYVKWPGAWGTVQVRPNDWYDTLDAAQDRACEMARAKLKSLDKQRKKLEAIAKDGAKVVGE